MIRIKMQIKDTMSTSEKEIHNLNQIQIKILKSIQLEHQILNGSTRVIFKM